jgi:hypothetical protein
MTVEGFVGERLGEMVAGDPALEPILEAAARRIAAVAEPLGGLVT